MSPPASVTSHSSHTTHRVHRSTIDEFKDPSVWLTGVRFMSIIIALVFLFGSSSPMFSQVGMPATPYSADASTLNTLPNIVSLAILGTVFARPALGGVGEFFQLISQRRLLKFRTIFEIEVWTTLASGGILLSLGETKWRRRTAMLITVAVATLHGLFISGFVSLLTSQFTEKVSQVVDTFQLDLLANSPTCVNWYNKQMRAMKSCNIKYNQLELTYQDCQVGTQMFGAIEAARASMLAHIMASVGSDDPQRYTSSLSRLGNTRILGSTAAVIPMGHFGIEEQAISSEISLNSTKFKIFSLEINIPLLNLPKPGRFTNYTLGLQGIEANVSCLYDEHPELHTAWASEYAEHQLSVMAGNHSLGDNTWTYYLRTCFRDCGLSSLASNETAYAGIGSMTCSVNPRLREVNSTYDSTLEAFIMEPTEGNYTTADQPTQIFDAVFSLTQQVLVHSNTRRGSLVASLVDSLAVSQYGLPGGVKNESYPALIASMIKGIFEYEGTLLRLNMTNSKVGAPGECRRPVLGTTTTSMMGVMEGQRRPVVTVVLMTTVSVVSLIGVLWSSCVSIRARKKGMPFDPTLAVSLIGASAAGGLQFRPEIIGEPENSTVRNTKVKYAAISAWDGEPDRWGLVALDDGEGKTRELGDTGEGVELLGVPGTERPMSVTTHH